MGPKWILKQFLRSCGFDIVRHDPASLRPLNVLDLAVECVASACRDFYFVQIGANDGIRHDPLRPLVLRHRLAGLLVEPLPDIFEDLQRNYSGVPGLRFVNAAAGNASGNLRIARFRRDAPVHDDLHSIASADIARLRRFARRRGVEHFIEELDVPCLSIEELLESHDVKHVDLLQLDVEGHELELLRAVFLAGFAPTIVNMEHLHLGTEDRIQAQRLLVTHGYSYVYTGIDLIATLPRERWRGVGGAQEEETGCVER